MATAIAHVHPMEVVMRGGSIRWALALGCVLAGFAATPAFADKIDGDWCNGAANFHIDGPAIRTPAGKDMTGDYSRHSFHYTSPDGEKDVGAEIYMRLMNEETVFLTRRVGGTDGPVETWIRCKPIS
jgi:hypothetical protein